MNSQGAILFGKEYVQYMLFRSTVNCVCPVVCSVTTTIGSNEEAVIPALLEASTQYRPGDSILLEPRQETFARPLLGARVLVSYSSAVVPVLITNLSNQSVTITKDKVLCDDDRATPLSNTCANKLSPNCSQAQQVSTTRSGPQAVIKENLPIQQAMANADATLTPDQRSALETLLIKHSGVFDWI